MSRRSTSRTVSADQGPLPANEPSKELPANSVISIRNGNARRGSVPLKNEKYERFAAFIARGQSPAGAYVSCGYQKSGASQSASRLLRRPEIAERVEELRRNVSREAVTRIAVNHAWVSKQLVGIVLSSMQAEPLVDHDGNPTGEYTFKAAEATHALVLLGRQLGMFKGKHKGAKFPNIGQRMIDGYKKLHLIEKQKMERAVRRRVRELMREAPVTDANAGCEERTPAEDQAA